MENHSCRRVEEVTSTPCRRAGFQLPVSCLPAVPKPGDLATGNCILSVPTLILKTSQHNKGAGLQRLHPLFFSPSDKILIFCPRVKYDPLGFQTQNVVNMLGLALRPYVKSNSMHILNGRLLENIQDLLPEHRSILDTHWNDFMVVFL